MTKDSDNEVILPALSDLEIKIDNHNNIIKPPVFSWKPVSLSKTMLSIQIDFEYPIDISDSTLDTLTVKFSN